MIRRTSGPPSANAPPPERVREQRLEGRRGGGGARLARGALRGALFLLLSVSAADPAADVQAAIEAIVAAKAAQYECGFAIAVRAGGIDGAPGFTAQAAGGYADIGKKIPMTPDSKFVWGSVTKMATGSAILRLADAGAFSLDDPVAPLVDGYIAQMVRDAPPAPGGGGGGGGGYNFSSLADLFGPEAAQITVRQLATMRSGVPDYDTAKPNEQNRSLSTDAFRATCYAHPAADYAPLDMLAVPWVHTGALDFAPGTDQDYSSTNFLLLGVVLAAHAGSAHWYDFDQSSFRPPALAAAGFMGRTRYAARGPPSQYTDVRGYDRTSYNGHDPDARPGIDVGDVHGVFAGWTASDLVAPVADVAAMAHALYADPSQLVAQADVAMMTNASQGFYGFATFLLSGYSGQPTDGPVDYGSLWGHLGATYGYNSMVEYNAALNVSIAVATNVESDFQAQPSDAFCGAYNAVLEILTGAPDGNCSYLASGYYGGCVCSTTKYACVTSTRHGHVEGRCEPSYFGNTTHAQCSATCGQ